MPHPPRRGWSGLTNPLELRPDHEPCRCASGLSSPTSRGACGYHIEGCGLGAERGLAYIAHVVDMKVDQLAESLQSRYTGFARHLAKIDLALGVGCPTPCVVPAQEGLADV